MILEAATPVLLCGILEKRQKKSWTSRNQNQPLLRQSLSVSGLKYVKYLDTQFLDTKSAHCPTWGEGESSKKKKKSMMTLCLENFQPSIEKQQMKLLLSAGKYHHHPVPICWHIDHQDPANLCCFFSLCSTETSWSYRSALLSLLCSCECKEARGDPGACLPKSCKI